MKKLLIYFLLLSIISNGFAQNNKADSLEQLLRTEIADTTRVLILVELARNYSYISPDTSLILAQQGIVLARRVGFVKGEARCLNSLGVNFLLTGNYAKSLEYLLQALKKFETLHDQIWMANAYGNMGNVYSEMGDEKQSIFNTRKQRTIAESMHNTNLVAITSLNLGDSYEKLNHLDSARIYTNQAYETALRNNIPSIRVLSLNNLGNVYSKMQQPEIAMAYYHQCLKDPEISNNNELVCETTLNMAKLFKNARQADSAVHYSRLSLAAASDGGFTKRILNASKFLSDYFKGLHQLDSAYYYQEITIAAKDSVFSQEKVKEVQNLSFTERIRQNEIEEANKQAEKERKSNIQLIGIAAFISFFFGLLFVFSKRKAKPKIIKFLGLLGLLLLFEFISLFLHPYIATLTHHTPVLILIAFVLIASALVPVHHKLEYWVKEKLEQH